MIKYDATTPPLTVGDIRKAIEGLADGAPVVVEDPNCRQAFVEGCGTRNYILVRCDTGNTCISDGDLARARAMLGDGVVQLELKNPVLVIEISCHISEAP